MKQFDVVFVNTNSAKTNYQDLANKYTAIEPPTWSLLLAESCRAKGFDVEILDAEALALSDDDTVEVLKIRNPRLVCFVTYGQNPNSGTTNMIGVKRVAKLLRETSDIKTLSIGSHTSALPYEVLEYDGIDFISINEGVKLLHKLLATDLKTDLHKIPGLGYKQDGLPIVNNGVGSLVTQKEMDELLPGYAWDLLPYLVKPLDLYRAHVWHPYYDESKRTPFAAIYTSLGCQFKCSFCMINIVNRIDEKDGVTAADSSGMRFWSTDLITKEFDKLAKLGVETVRISDEMFFLNKKYYEPLLDNLINKDYKINTWTYARIDTVNEKYLTKFKQAGVNWLALGIEAANQIIRQEITKGKFKEVDIREIVKLTEAHGIEVVANYIFGFPNENLSHLQETLDLALELNASFANMYCATALPGSPLYLEARKNNWALPETLDGYGFLGYNHLPMRTNHLTAAEVLRFRDDAWHKYFERPVFLDKIEKKFGIAQRQNIEELSKIKLKRKLLGD